MRPVRLVAAAVMVAAGLWAIPAAASAQSLTGCSGSAQSKDGDGNVVDDATASKGAITGSDGKEEFSASNPFEVDNDGVVDYSGKTDSVITDHSWNVKIMGIEVASGGSANRQRKQTSTDTFDVGDHLPVKITGLVKVEGEISGDGGSCSGSGYVKLKGNPLASPLTWAGVLLAGLGVFGVLKARPRRVGGGFA